MKKILISVIAVAAAAAAISCSKDSMYSRDGGIYGYDASYAENGGDELPNSGDDFSAIVENGFIKASEQPTSTFSIDADGATYAYMRRCVNMGFLPGGNAVRIEEYLNYFTFDYPEPAGGETVAVNAETGVCPWNTEHRLLRLGLKGKSLSDSEIPDANYILLIDTSGSMNGDDRLGLIKKGLTTMLDYMKPSDRIAIITYSGAVKRLLESTLVSDAAKIKRAINSLNASGGTAGGPAMKMAYDEAVAHYVSGGNNRIIMCTDGDFNVGVSNTTELVEMVENYLDKGIYLSIMGFGMGNFQDSRMEEISNHGNGTYNYIDSEEEMMKVFVNERSRFFSVANDTKCQVSFNPAAVDSYRLIGYENRVLANEDFDNDKKDAGEIGAGQTITALYEIVPAEGFTSEENVASFDVRYKKAIGEDSRALSLSVGNSVTESQNLNLAAGIAAYGLCLRDSKFKGESSLPLARELVQSSLGFDPNGFRAQLVELIRKAEKLR